MNHIEAFEVSVQHKQGEDNIYRASFSYKDMYGFGRHKIVKISSYWNASVIERLEINFYDGIDLTPEALLEFATMIANNENRIKDYINKQEKISIAFEGRERLPLI